MGMSTHITAGLLVAQRLSFQHPASSANWAASPKCGVLSRSVRGNALVSLHDVVLCAEAAHRMSAKRVEGHKFEQKKRKVVVSGTWLEAV
jgi:hypothetical protein